MAVTEDHAHNPNGDSRSGVTAAPGDRYRGSLAGGDVTVIAGRCFQGKPTAVGRPSAFLARSPGQRWPWMDGVSLLASELSSNAARHTASGQGSRLRVTVSVNEYAAQVDETGCGRLSGRRIPARQGITGAPAAGRRLRIVAALAAACDYRGYELGPVTRFERPAEVPGQDVRPSAGP